MVSDALNIASKTSYLQKEPCYRKNQLITEYDIKSAGFNVLKYLRILPEDTLKEWQLLDKHTRTVKEGLLQRKYPEVAEKIINTLSDIRQEFVSANNIESKDILSIKKDAIFLINKNPKNLKFKDGLFEFRKKGQYTSFLYVQKCEFYYSSLTDELDIKGLSENIKLLQNEYFLKDIKRILRSSEKILPDQIYTMLKEYRKNYIERKLPLEAYRELTSEKFRIDDWLVSDITEDERDVIDITQNYMNFLLPIIQTLL